MHWVFIKLDLFTIFTTLIEIYWYFLVIFLWLRIVHIDDRTGFIDALSFCFARDRICFPKVFSVNT